MNPRRERRPATPRPGATPDDPMHVDHLLGEVGLFANLGPRELALLSSVAVRKSYQRDEFILRETDPGHAFYMIVSGRVKICLYSGDGQETILSFLSKGDFFGEMALFLESTRTANVIALESTVVFQIHREQFYALLQHHINITKNIIQTLCLRLRQANFSINSLAHLDVSGRLARFLIDQAGAAGTRKNDWVVIARLTHQEIAGRIATSRETVSRLLKQLEGSGCILCRRDGLYIHTRFLT